MTSFYKSDCNVRMRHPLRRRYADGRNVDENAYLVSGLKRWLNAFYVLRKNGDFDIVSRKTTRKEK